MSGAQHSGFHYRVYLLRFQLVDKFSEVPQHQGNQTCDIRQAQCQRARECHSFVGQLAWRHGYFGRIEPDHLPRRPRSVSGANCRSMIRSRTFCDWASSPFLNLRSKFSSLDCSTWVKYFFNSTA